MKPTTDLLDHSEGLKRLKSNNYTFLTTQLVIQAMNDTQRMGDFQSWNHNPTSTWDQLATTSVRRRLTTPYSAATAIDNNNAFSQWEQVRSRKTDIEAYSKYYNTWPSCSSLFFCRAVSDMGGTSLWLKGHSLQGKPWHWNLEIRFLSNSRKSL